MAFDQDNIAPMTTGLIKGPNIWSYAAGTDQESAVDDAGYFNSARKLLKVGDLILASLSSDGTKVNDNTYLFRVATVPDSGNITVTNVGISNTGKIG